MYNSWVLGMDGPLFLRVPAAILEPKFRAAENWFGLLWEELDPSISMGHNDTQTHPNHNPLCPPHLFLHRQTPSS